MNSIKFLSINTDASFHPQTKYGGWAFVTLGEGIRIIKKGKFKICPSSSTEAETKAIINAITDLLNKEELPEIEHIVIHRDCESIIKALRTSKNHYILLLRKVILKLKRKVKCNNIQVKHIKAHTKNKGKYFVINRYLDKWAKEKMRKQLKQ